MGHNQAPATVLLLAHLLMALREEAIQVNNHQINMDSLEDNMAHLKVNMVRLKVNMVHLNSQEYMELPYKLELVNSG